MLQEQLIETKKEAQKAQNKLAFWTGVQDSFFEEVTQTISVLKELKEDPWGTITRRAISQIELYKSKPLEILNTISPVLMSPINIGKNVSNKVETLLTGTEEEKYYALGNIAGSTAETATFVVAGNVASTVGTASSTVVTSGGKVVSTGGMSSAKTEVAIAPYDAKFAAQQLLKNQTVTEQSLQIAVPKGTPNTFKPSTTIESGYKYNYTVNGTKIEIKWHSADMNAAIKYPTSNSANGWTAQIKVGNKLLGSDGKFYKSPSNITHIPVLEVN